MKKIVSALVAVLISLSALSVYAKAEGINLLAPAEIEIMPTRDFYVIGTIDRGGKSAKEMPLNIRVNLVNSSGMTVRSVESNVSSDGQTPDMFFLTEYSNGSSKNDGTGNFINLFTPPDVVYDGNERDSIRNAYNKIVVKDDYFAAVIYGGASKDFELKYFDKYEKGLTDITQGEYDLVIVALDLYGEEIYRTKEKIAIGNKAPRLITALDLSEYAKDEGISLSNSLAGYWDIGNVASLKTSGYIYSIPRRFLINSNLEYGKSKNVNILLNYLDLENQKIATALGSAFDEESEAEISYVYFDIGDDEITFDFAGDTLTKKAKVKDGSYSDFIEICRAETLKGDFRAVDFNVDDGIVINNEIVLYGVYTPVEPKAVLTNNTYKITNDVSMILAQIVDENEKVIFSQDYYPSLTREDTEYSSPFEFEITVEANEKMFSSKKLELKLYTLDSNGEILSESPAVPLKAIPDGEFISDYDDSYWGKIFCDTVNIYGEAPNTIALKPDSHITRGDFAAMANRLLGYSVTGETKFADLDEDSVFYDDCVTAKEVGYMTGDEKGNVNADSLIKREEAMIILARISGAEKSDREFEFKDSDLISFWAKDYVDAMCSAGIVSGFEGYINPQKNITVAEAAALIIKTVKWMHSDEEVLPVGVGNNFIAPENVTNMAEIEINNNEFDEGLNEETVTEFFVDNAKAFVAIADYLRDGFAENGVYIGKVGKGLEIRDYKKGNILKLSEDAVRLLESMGNCFNIFSVRYNTTKNEDIYFALGKDNNNKEFGIINTSSAKISGRKLTPIGEDWYYYIQQ